MPNPENVINKGKEFPKGVSGNPKGRPPKTATEFMREFGESELIDVSIRVRKSNGEEVIKRIDAETMKDKKGRTVTLNKVLAATMWQQAIAGDLATQKELLNRTEGVVSKENDSLNDTNKLTPAQFVEAMVSATTPRNVPPETIGVVE